MKKRSLFCLLLLLFLFSHTAFAANWQFHARVPDPVSDMVTIYVDADSATKSGGKLIYWTLVVLDTPFMEFAKQTTKLEVNLAQPRQYRVLEIHRYDQKNKEWDADTETGDWTEPEPEDELEIAFALKIAKDGKGTAKRPLP